MKYYGMNGETLSMEEVASLYNDPNARKVAYDEFGDVHVSTVLLGIDHRFAADGPPVIFETMIFGGDHDGEQWRYSTREEALEGHRNACAIVEPTD